MPPAPRSVAARWVLVLTAVSVATATGAGLRRTPARAQPPPPTASATPCVIAATLRGQALRDRVHACAASGHTPISYGSVDTRVLEVTEEDPQNTANVIDIYFNLSMPKVGTPERPWEVEHVWPRSYGFDGSPGEDCLVPLSDAHNLFVAHPLANGPAGHSNHPYDDCDHECTPMPTGAPPDMQNRRGRDAEGTPVFEVRAGRRGDIARALLYMDVRYDGGSTGGGGLCAPELRLVDRPAPIGGLGNGIAQYGRLSTILRWALQDKVDDGERRRNDVIAQRDKQGNRNPFVDDEGLICRMFPVGPCRPTPAFLPAVFRP